MLYSLISLSISQFLPLLPLFQYDTTVGMAAGPFGEGDRFPTITNVTGNWERTIAIYRTTYSHVTQARKPSATVPATQAGLVWWGPHVASTTVFLPFSAAVGAVAPSLSLGDPYTLDRNSIYWAMKYVYNLKRMRYAPMMADIKIAQAIWEEQGRALVAQIDTASPPMSVAQVTQAYSDFTTKLMAAWWQFADALMVKYGDGNDYNPYPAWWLQSPDVGYENGPPSEQRAALGAQRRGGKPVIKY